MTNPDETIDNTMQTALDSIRPVPGRDPRARARGRARFLSEARELQSQRSPARWLRLAGFFGLKSPGEKSPARTFRLSTLALTLLLFLALLSSGSAVTAYAAQTALPGDPLYGIKNVTEDAQVRLNPDPGADADLHLLFAQRRLEEIRGLIEKGRFEDIPIATRAFERHILQAIGALGQLATTDPVRAGELTQQILASLASYTDALTAYLGDVPAGSPQQALEMAVNTSQVTFRPSEIEFHGVISSIEINHWVIADKTVQITLQTRIEGLLQIGDLAEVDALVAANGELTAREIKPVEQEPGENAEMEFTGQVEQIAGETWAVAGQVVILTAETEVEGSIQVGDMVHIEGLLQDDGTLVAKTIKLAENPEEIKENNTNDNQLPVEDTTNDNGGEDNGDETEAVSEDNENTNGNEEDGGEDQEHDGEEHAEEESNSNEDPEEPEDHENTNEFEPEEEHIEEPGN